jgi:hypothetical protein
MPREGTKWWEDEEEEEKDRRDTGRRRRDPIDSKKQLSLVIAYSLIDYSRWFFVSEWSSPLFSFQLRPVLALSR